MDSADLFMNDMNIIDSTDLVRVNCWTQVSPSTVTWSTTPL